MTDQRGPRLKCGQQAELFRPGSLSSPHCLPHWPSASARGLKYTQQKSIPLAPPQPQRPMVAASIS